MIDHGLIQSEGQQMNSVCTGEYVLGVNVIFIIVLNGFSLINAEIKQKYKEITLQFSI